MYMASEPQIPQALILMRTSRGPTSGTGVSTTSVVPGPVTTQDRIKLSSSLTGLRQTGVRCFHSSGKNDVLSRGSVPRRMTWPTAHCERAPVCASEHAGIGVQRLW
jgi:hypothetical protein